MRKILFLCFFFFFSQTIIAGELNGSTYWDGLKKSFTYLYQGSYMQFQEKNNLYYSAAAVPALWYSFDQDKRISDNARTKSIPKVMQLSSDLAPVMGFPVISFAAFTYGVKTDNPKMVQFAEEYFGAMYIAFLESSLLSRIQVHRRPSEKNLASIETKLRGDSSFPSGHVIPYATLALKTFQFYGPYAAVAPTALFVLTSMQRVRDGKHYLSDIVGGFFLSTWASEGVRRAGNFSDNHPAYKFLFERNVAFGIIEYEGTIGPRITFDL